MFRFRPALLVAFLFSAGLLSACTSNSDSGDTTATAPLDTISPQSKADSVAYRMLQAHGANAWATAPYLRFNFGIETPDGSQVIARHFWNRETGEYRVEWSSGPDSSYVAIVNVREVEGGLPSGTAYLNGAELSGSANEKARKQAYGRYINDTYWLLAPLKVYDPGVQRTYLPDSSTGEHDVIHLSFENVGMTPGDEYWWYVSKETGRLERWAYHLQGMADDMSPRHYDWTAYQEMSAPEGVVRLASRKKTIGGNQAILTNALALPSRPPDGTFSNSEAMLGTAE